MSDFDPYRKWLGIPPQEQPPNHYRLLGIGLYESDADVISNAADRQMAHVRTFQSGKYSALSQQLLNELSAARVCLLDAAKRQGYDEELRRTLTPARAAPPPPRVAPPSPVGNHVPPPVAGAPVPPVVYAPPVVNGTASASGTPPAPPAAKKPAAPFFAPDVAPARPGSYGARPRRPENSHAAPVAIGGAIVIAILGVAIWALSSSRPSPSPPSSPSTEPPRRSGPPIAKYGGATAPPRGRPNGTFANNPPRRIRDPMRQPPQQLVIPDNTPPVEDVTHLDAPAGTPKLSDTNAAPATSLTGTGESASAGEKDPAETPATPAAKKRLPVPEADAQKAAEERIRNTLFKEDFAATKPSEKTALAQKLATEGAKPETDPAAAYVMLRLSSDLHTEMADADAALAAIDELAARYDVDALGIKAETIQSLAKVTAGSAHQRSLVEKTLELLDEALAADNFKMAESLPALAQGIAARIRDKGLTERIAVQGKRILQCRQQYATVREAAETLKANPADPAANEAVGRYACFVKGNWDEGLPRLAAGADIDLKKLAEADLGNPTDAAPRLAVGDAWWAAAEKQTGRMQEQFRRRAARWYKLVVPDLKGDDKNRIEARLTESGDPTSLITLESLPPLSGLECREPSMRATLLKRYGGNEATEAAVDRALEWLDRHQFSNGSWNFNHRACPKCDGKCPDPGTLDNSPNAATALALLPLLGAGNGLREGKYRKNVNLGLGYLKAHMVRMGPVVTFYEEQSQGIPSHPLVTLALCEAAAGGRDKLLRAHAQAAVRFILRTQNPDGGWSSRPKGPKQEASPSGVFPTDWNLFALQAARWAGLVVEDAAFTQAGRFLDKMQMTNGYRAGGNGGRDPQATATAMLLRIYLGWPHDRPDLLEHVTTLSKTGPSTTGQYYQNFCNGQVMREFGGGAWEPWNTALRQHLLKTQSTDGHAAGSWWLSSDDVAGRLGGRLYATAMAALLLEVYYRNPPVYVGK